MNYLSGTIIKDYELREYIGAGRFGVVYRAYQSSMGREVAMKIILPEFANRPAFIHHFESDTQVIAGLEHPHILPLHNFWRSPEGAYLVMRWLQDGNLSNTLKNGPFDVKAASLLLDQATAALSVAHRHQVIHRTLKPANIVMDEDGNAYVADFEIVSVSDLSSDEVSSLIGSSDYISPEQARSEPVSAQTDIYSLGLILFEILTAQSPFSGFTPAERLSKQLNDPLPSVGNLPDDIVEAVNAVIQKATAKNPAQRYPDVLAMAVAFRKAAKLNRNESPDGVVATLTRREQEVLQRIVAGHSNKEIAEEFSVELATIKSHIRQLYSKLHVRSRVQAIVRARELHLITPAVAPSAIGSTQAFEPTNPYKGLYAFEAADAPNFFGRESLIDQLIARLGETGEQSRFLAVIGPSGSGKSSLVMAGLIPALWRGALPGSEHWFAVDMLPGTNPLDELEATLMRVAINQASNIGELLQHDERGLIRVAQLILPNDGSQLFLIIDQFEQVFTLVEDEKTRVHFLKLLYNAVNVPRSRIWVVLTLRADCYDRPLQYPDFGELLHRRMETVLPLSAAGLERAIARPAEQVGLTFEPGLVTAIISEVNDQPGALPLLQYALTELFEHRQGDCLTHETYQAVGGTVGALARCADEIYNELDTESQRVARQMFLRLVTLGEGIEDTRRRIPRSALSAIADNEETIDDLIDTYTEYRLLALDHDPITRGPTVELAHEAILRAWTRLRGWLDSSREELRTERRLAIAALEWATAGRDPSFLAIGIRLDEFESWTHRTTLALNTEEVAYLQASVDHQAERVAKEKALKIELGVMEQEVRTRRRLISILFAVITLAGIIALTAGLFAANEGEQIIEAERTLAPVQVTLTDVSQQVLKGQRLTESLRLAAAANTELTSTAGNPELAALLAVRSLKIAYVPLADETLMQATEHLYVKRQFSQPAAVLTVTISPDGKTALTGGKDKTVRLLDLQTGMVVRQFTGFADDVLAVAFSPDGKTVLAGSADTTVRLWDAVTGVAIRSFEGHSGGVTSVAFSPDGNDILTGGQDKTIALWNTTTGEAIRRFSGHTDAVMSVSFSPDGKTIISGSLDKTARLWDVATGDEIRQFVAQSPVDGVLSVAFSPDGKSILTAGQDHIAWLWDTNTGMIIRRFDGHTKTVSRAVFVSDGTAILTASFDGTVRLWNTASGQLQRQFTGHMAEVFSVAVSPDGSAFLTGSADKTARLWSIGDSQAVQIFNTNSDALEHVAFSPDGKLITAGDGDHTAWIWNLVTHQARQLIGHSNYVASAVFSPDGKLMLTSSLDKTARLWDTLTGQTIREFVGHTAPVVDAAFSPDGQFVVTASLDQTARLWETNSGRLVRIFSGHTGGVIYATFSPDGKILATASQDHTARLWDVATGELVRELKGHNDGVIVAVFSPDGKTLLTGAGDNLARLWDVQTGALLREFIGHSSGVWDAAFSPDGTMILTGSMDQTARLWDVQTGQTLRQFVGHTAGILGVAFSPDGRTILTGSQDHTARLWPVDYLDLVNVACNTLVRDFTDTERLKFEIKDNTPTCPQVIQRR